MPALTVHDADFAAVVKLAYDRFGLDIPQGKRGMIENRLTKMARKVGVSTCSELLEYVGRDDEPERMLGLFDVLSTNLTSFFREDAHFRLLEKHILEPAMRATKRGGSRKLRLWSAGCSSGCEAFTLGIVLKEAMPDLASWDARILATDLSKTEVEMALSGVYPAKFCESMPTDLRAKYLSPCSPPGARGASREKHYAVAPVVRDLVTIGILNLMEPWPMKGPFDSIFCRNVMIYFDLPTREKLVRRYTSLLRPGGLLCIGCSENLSGDHPELRRVGPSAFVREVGGRA